jgi:hypothetical protein
MELLSINYVIYIYLLSQIKKPIQMGFFIFLSNFMFYVT